MTIRSIAGLVPALIVAACASRGEVPFDAAASNVRAAAHAPALGKGVWQMFTVGPSYPQGILRRAGGDFWVAGGDHSTSITRFTPAGKSEAFNVGTTPLEMTEDRSGNLWFTTNPYQQNILYVKLRPHFSTREFTTSDDASGGMTLGADGAIWFVQSSHIGRLTSSGKLREYSANPQGYTGIVWSHGLLWFRGDSLMSLNPRSGEIKSYYPPMGCCGGAIVADAQGTLWYMADSQMVSFDPAKNRWYNYGGAPPGFTPYGAPADTAIAPDGSIWYCAQRLRRTSERRVVGGGFVRFDPRAKTFTAFAAPKGYDWNWDMVAAPNGTLWSTAGSDVVVLKPQR